MSTLHPSSSWLPALLACFPAVRDGLRGSETVPPQVVPARYAKLLVHARHMTAALEAHHGAPVRLHVDRIARDRESYARSITLRVADEVVLAGAMRVFLEHCDEAVEEEIVRARKPIGRILVEHGVLRRIEPERFLRVHLPSGYAKVFASPQGTQSTYGRLAVVFFDERPAIELLEIVAPDR